MQVLKLIKAAFSNKCPRCYAANFFESSYAFSLKNFTKMYKSCTYCKQDFEQETGFYYGAMYVSYALTVTLALPIMYLTVFVLDFSALYFLLTIIPVILLATPFFYRASRIIWLAIFLKREEKL